MYLYGSGMGNPSIHSHRDLPIVVVGGKAGKGALHVKYAEPTPMANLHLTLLDKAGIRLDAFGDSQGKVKEMEPLVF